MDQARKNAAESVPPSSHQTVLSTDMYDFCTAPLAADMAKSPSNEDHGMCEDTSDKRVVKAETEEPPCKKQRASLGPSYASSCMYSAEPCTSWVPVLRKLPAPSLHGGKVEEALPGSTSPLPYFRPQHDPTLPTVTEAPMETVTPKHAGSRDQLSPDYASSGESSSKSSGSGSEGQSAELAEVELARSHGFEASVARAFCSLPEAARPPQDKPHGKHNFTRTSANGARVEIQLIHRCFNAKSFVNGRSGLKLVFKRFGWSNFDSVKAGWLMECNVVLGCGSV